jgi:hypothetical protein
MEYWILYGSGDAGENGIYCGDKQVCGWRELWKAGYDLCEMVGWKSSTLKRIAYEVTHG